MTLFDVILPLINVPLGIAVASAMYRRDRFLMIILSVLVFVDILLIFYGGF